MDFNEKGFLAAPLSLPPMWENKMDTKKLVKEAKDELVDEIKDTAKADLKYLYKQQRKAAIVLQNIGKDIETYLDKVEEEAKAYTEATNAKRSKSKSE